jgi:alcohol dehydrogenase
MPPASLAHDLGAAHHIDSASQNVADELQKLGGAKVVLATATSGPAMSATVDGLVWRGELIVVGATPDMVEASGYQMIGGMRKIYCHAAGTAIDTEQTLRFAAQSGVHPWIQEVALEQAEAAFAKMLSGGTSF